MPEYVRNLVGRLRAALADRRRAPRKTLRVACTVSLPDPHSAQATQHKPQPSLSGTTRDVSTSGVAFVLPAVRVGGRYLTDTDLRLRLELADGALEMTVHPVRYEQLPPESAETGYFIGARITDIDDDARTRLENFLRS